MRYEIDPISAAALDFTGEICRRHTLRFDESLGLPLLAEHERVHVLWETLDRARKQTSLKQLFIVFINQRESDPIEVVDSNLKTLKFFSVPEEFRFSLQPIDRDYVLLINGAFFPLKEKEGVGRARKVLADLALGLWKEGWIRSELHRQTDADVKVPEDYFSTSLSKEAVAATYPYRHSRGELTEDEFVNLLIYERWLASYCEGLEQAGSPYCYWALGSTLMFCLSAYEKIRGFPNVRAGEDFHFLSKMRKLGIIHRLETPVLEILGRHSTRVPFGTGRALDNMAIGRKAYELYPKVVFDDLKKVLNALNFLTEHCSLDTFFSELDIRSQKFFEDYRKSFGNILRQRSSQQQKHKLLHEAFDALATLRWINSRLIQ